MTDPRFVLVGAKAQAEAAPQKMRRHRPPYSTAVVLALIVLPCLLAEVVMTRDPAYMDLAHCLVAPCREFIFGTDSLGRDIFSMIWYGGRISLIVGFLATVIATALAMIIGSLSALAPRWLDALLMHITDILLSVPSLLLVLFLQAFFRQNSVFTLSIVLGITGWMGMSRVVRTEVLQLRGCEYMEAARLMGGSFFYLLRRHLAPNFIPSLIQCFSIAGKSSVRSLKVYPLNPAVCAESTAEGSMQVSIPHADSIGSATVREHCPTHDISCIVSIFLYDIFVLITFLNYKHTTDIIHAREHSVYAPALLSRLIRDTRCSSLHILRRPVRKQSLHEAIRRFYPES
ncbi:MAG: ABC transporter permease, partial [Firmicutes bacterium]|nr:ABC transporter permease [Bacillota bacterium]